MNASKNKGTVFESAVRDYLRWALCDPKIDRAALHGMSDIGDISGVFYGNTPVVIECKSRKRPQAYEALDEAIQESGNLEKVVGGMCLPAAVVHLPGIGIKSPQKVGQQLVIMPYGDLSSTYMCGASSETAEYSAIYRSKPARLHTYRDVELTIKHKDDHTVCGFAAELPGHPKDGDRLVDITCLRDFAIMLNRFHPLGGANVR